VRRTVISLAFVLPLVPVLAAAAGASDPSSRAASETSSARTVVLRGVVRLLHGDRFPAPSMEGVLLDTGERAFDLDLPTAQAEALAGATVQVTGRVRSNLVTPVGPLEVVATAAETMGMATAGSAVVKKVVVMLVNFSNNTAQPWDKTAVENLILDANLDNPNSVRAFYAESSENSATIEGAVLGWYTIAAADGPGCGMSTWASQAASAASADALAAGYDLASADVSKIYAFPTAVSCLWEGAGELPGDDTWINGPGGMTLRTVAHELAHNWGVHHATSLSCTDAAGGRVSITARQGDDCVSSEYGDPFTIMGASATRTHLSWHRAQLGFAMGTTIVTPTATMDERYTLTALEPAVDGSAVRLLRIARPTSPASYLDLEIRAPQPPFDVFSSTDPAVLGVSARIGWLNSNLATSRLLDATLGTAGFSDAPIAVGAAGIWDPVAGVRVTVDSVSGGVATVRIKGEPDVSAPTAVTNLIATADATPRVTLTWAAATDDKTLAGYEVRRNGVRCAIVKGLTVADVGAWPTCPGLAAGQSYTYAVAAYDASGKVAAAPSATVTLAGPQAPATVTVSEASRVITVAWSAASGAVSYEVVRDVYDARRARWSVQRSLTTTSVSITDTITKSGTYRYRVRSVSGGATSAYTTSRSITVSR
jgi:hypothetical protein